MAKVAQRFDWSEGDLLGLVDEVMELSEELGNWRDNLEEKFSNTAKYEEVSEAADELEQIHSDLSDAMESLQDQIGEKNYLAGRKLSLLASKGTSRPARAAKIQDKLGSLLDEYMAAAEEELEAEEEEGDSNNASEAQEILDLIDEVREHLDRLGDVNFPRAFGG